MEKKSHPDLHIEVRGRDRASTIYLCQVAQDALMHAGVESVEVVNQQGQHVRHKPTPSLLDIIEGYDPNFFASRVRIYTDDPKEHPVTVHEELETLDD